MNQFPDFNSQKMTTPSERKRPVLLTILLVLSALYIFTSMLGSLTSLSSGPIPTEEVDKQLATIYTAINDFQQQDAGEEMIESLKIMVESTHYINDNVFYLYNSLTLISLVVGLVSLIFMFQLKKIGFHLYIIYSLLPILIMYITLPIELVSTASVIISVILGTIFALLYGRNLSRMK